MNTHTNHNGKRKNYHRSTKKRSEFLQFVKKLSYCLQLNHRHSLARAINIIVHMPVYMRDRHPITGELLDSE